MPLSTRPPPTTTMPLAVGLDVGTQGAKALVYDMGTKRVVARGEGGGGMARARGQRRPRLRRLSEPCMPRQT